MKEQLATRVVIPCEDPLLHTEANGYTCLDETCPCNELAYSDDGVVVLSIGNGHYLAISQENASKLLDRLLLLMAQPHVTH